MGFSGTDAGGFQWEGFNSGAPNQPTPRQPKPNLIEEPTKTTLNKAIPKTITTIK